MLTISRSPNMKKTTITTTTRQAELRQMLSDRRRAMQETVQSHIRDARSDRASDVIDELEHSDADTHGDIEFAVLQMQTDTLARIDAALIQLDAGEYGSCASCGSEISETRLRALPFAVRCRSCEERREQGDAHTRRLTASRAGASLFSDAGRY
jgi:DnaK suppressor protein